MIDRYTRAEMGANWTLKSRFQCMLEVEVAVAQAQAQLGIIPKKAASDISKKSDFSLKRIASIEKKTKHDVIAFVTDVASNVGPMGRYVHFGMTSSDILDTALSVQIARASKIIDVDIKKYKSSLRKLAKKHKQTLCAGRTHGMHAEPTTFGLKMSGFLAEINRNEKRMNEAIESVCIAKLSGAVGTYSAQDQRVESLVAKKLKLQPELVATQVIPRDRHAQLLNTIALMGAGIERLSIELRHLQRTEVSEVIEGFSPGQKGSSAMPHKKNPISGENLTGVARLLRSYSQAALENVALWHERDISHSSVERVVFPDAFILLDYMLDRMTTVLDRLYVDKKRMRSNMDLSSGQLFSSHVLLELVESGLSREDAYAIVQRVSHGLAPGETLENALISDKLAGQYLDRESIREIFSGKRHMRSIVKVFDNAMKELS